jgi:hypothetical protein
MECEALASDAVILERATPDMSPRGNLLEAEIVSGVGTMSVA